MSTSSREPGTVDSTTARAQEIFDGHFQRLHTRIDRMFVVLMFIQWAFAAGCAMYLSPFAWDGAVRRVHPHVWLAIVLGGLLTGPATLFGVFLPARRVTRHVIALCQVGFSSLLIHITGGRIETHFHVFGSLAFLSFYRDWTVLGPATLFVAVDHLVRGAFWPETVFGTASPSQWRWLEHAGWVLFEDLWLIICCRQGIREAADISRRGAELEESHQALERQTEALAEAFRERSAFVEGALDAVVRMDDAGCITGWNSQAAKTFLWSAEEAIGRPLADTVIPQAYREQHRRGLARYLTTGEGPVLNRRIEVEAVDRHQRTFPIELAITPIRSGGRTHFCAFLRDISDRRQAEESLRQAKEAAEAANNAKSLFLANMSHEIRTPLNAILGFTDLMRTCEDRLNPKERSDYLNSVHRSGQHLLCLINDILDLSKIEAGQMQYERIRFSPHQIMMDVLSVMRVRASEKGLSLEARWLGPAPETILSDPARVRQLLLNLIGNAVKFTERGNVQLLAQLDVARELLQFDVVDTGVGIAPDKLEAIFAPFTQADVSVTRRFGGTGLGLSICRHIAQDLGGTVVARSELHRGSTFTVTIACGSVSDMVLLDVPPAEACRSLEAPLTCDAENLQGMSVLVVDDGDTNRKLLKLMLTRAGATIETATNGQEAVRRACAQSFDAVLMDMQMPVMDGYTATRQLRTWGVGTPVIALTAHAMSGEAERCLAAGCDSYLAKPVSRQQLMQTLSSVWESALRAREPNPAEAESGIATARTESIRSALNADDPELRAIVAEFTAALPAQIGEIDAAWSVREWGTLRDCAHSVKGTAAMTGYPQLSAVAGDLELAAECEDAHQVPRLLTAIETLVGRILAP